MNLSAEQQVYETSCRILGTTNFMITKIPSEGLRINQVLAIVFNGILIIPTILLNAVAIITIWKSSQLNRKPCYFIILVQSVTDLAVGLVSIPLFIFFLKRALGGYEKYCSETFLAFRLILLPVGLSTITLLALTLERYVAILHPYAYGSGVTKKRLVVFIGCCDAVEFSVFTLSLMNQRILEIYAVVKMTIVFLFIAFAYTKIFFVVRKLSRSQRRPQDPSSDANLTRMKLFLREIKQAKACLIVIICFSVLNFLPATIAIPLIPMLDRFEMLATIAWVITLRVLNSSANSVIFFWTKTMLRKEAIKTLKFTSSQ
jgi:large-conductance mechanosensitive channel